MEDILLNERNNIGTISKLCSLCQSFPFNPKSSFDPVYKISVKLKSLIDTLQTLYDRHCALYSKLANDISNNRNLSIYGDIDFLVPYETFFQNGIRLIFNSTNSIFRSLEESDFIKLFLSIYSHLKNSLENFTEEQKLNQAVKNFEKEFHLEFNKAYSNSYKGGNVIDILSYSLNKIQYPNIESKNIIQTHLVKLTSHKLGFRKVLVEIVELDTNELAFFKIESCLSVTPMKCTANNLLKELCMGKFQLLNFNKWLLFIPLKPNDIKIVEYNNTGLKLETLIGKNVQLFINSENLLEWETIWKKKFEQYFGDRRETPSKRKKLLSLEPFLNDFDVDPFEKHHQNFTKHNNKKPDLNSQVYPVCDSIDSNPPLIKEKSISEIEHLSYEKLLELNNSIPIELSPAPQQTPLPKQIIRSVSDTCTIEQVDPRISIESDMNETQSIISEIEDIHLDNNNDDEDSTDKHDNSSIFYSNISNYEPRLLKRKSSSLLSLLSAKKKSDKEQIEHMKLDFSNSFSQSSSIFGEIKNGMEEPTKETYVPGLPQEELVNSLELFHDRLIKLSFWTKNNCWEKIGDKNITFDISRLRNGSIIMCAYKGEDRNKCYIVSRISSKLKAIQTTAQDIQLKFSGEDIIRYSFPHDLDTFMLTARYPNVEVLLNILQKSITNNFNGQLSSSVTEETLSTKASSNLTSSIFSYKTSSSFSSVSLDKFETNDSFHNTSLGTKNTNTKIQLHLLLSDIMTKYHSLENGKFWKLLDEGSTTIYSQDILHSKTNLRIGAAFEFVSSTGTTRKFDCHVSNIHRLKKTGIVIKDNSAEYHLLAFTNSTIANHVFKLINAAF